MYACQMVMRHVSYICFMLEQSAIRQFSRGLSPMAWMELHAGLFTVRDSSGSRLREVIVDLAAPISDRAQGCTKAASSPAVESALRKSGLNAEQEDAVRRYLSPSVLPVQFMSSKERRTINMCLIDLADSFKSSVWGCPCPFCQVSSEVVSGALQHLDMQLISLALMPAEHAVGHPKCI